MASENMSPRSSIYTALRTMDVGDVDPTSDQSSVWSTPVKQRLSPTISYASSSSLAGSPSYPYRSPSIPYTSPSSNRLLQTPIHGSSTSGIVHETTEKIKARCIYGYFSDQCFRSWTKRASCLLTNSKPILAQLRITISCWCCTTCRVKQYSQTQRHML